MTHANPFTLDTEVKAKWVAALRSGEYKQGTRFLQADGCNCCLGVLANLDGIPSREFEAGCMKLSDFDFSGEGRYDYTTFPPEGFHGMPGSVMRNLASMNDGVGSHRKHSFAEIADFIEKNL